MKSFVITFLLLSNLIVAQSLQPFLSWSKTFGGNNNDEGWAIEKTIDGGFLIAGYTISFSSSNWSDIYIIRTDSNGDTLWTKTIGDSLDEYASDIKRLPDGNFIVAGYGRVNSPNNYDALLIKIDQDGNVLWTKSYGGSNNDDFAEVEIVNDGLIAVGTTNSISLMGNKEVYLLKTDFNGNVHFFKTFNFGDFSEGHSIKELHGGGFIIAGANYFSNTNYNIFIVRCDKDGNFIWQKSFGGAGNEIANSVIQLNTTKEIYITGYTVSYGNGYSDIFIMKLNELGDSIWFKTYGYLGNDYGNTIKLTNDLNLVVVGYGRLDNSNQVNLFLLKTDLSGNLLWLVDAGGIFEDRGYDFVETNDYGYAVVGIAKSSTTINNLFLVKFDSEYKIDEPEILAINDVPNDNGKQVFVIWNPSDNDGIFNNPVLKYSVWRQDNQIWTFVGETPAIGSNLYSFVAPTIFDSSIVNGIYWSVFKVIAHGIAPYILSTSLPDSGYSIDNLIPHTPDSVRAIIYANFVKLLWSEPVDEDFQYFAVFRDTVSNFDVVNKQPIAQVVQSSFEDYNIELNRTYFYKIVAIDFSGNKSLPSKEISVNLTNIETSSIIPVSFILYQNFPNPFNNSTNIVFDLPEEIHVKLSIYDALGRKLETLIDRELKAGKYSIQFDSKDYPSALYFCKIESEKFNAIKKMVLLK